MGSTRVLLDDNGFEHDDEASTVTGCVYISTKKVSENVNAAPVCFTTSYGIHSLELEY